jgi:hypothetical protein
MTYQLVDDDLPAGRRRLCPGLPAAAIRDGEMGGGKREEEWTGVDQARGKWNKYRCFLAVIFFGMTPMKRFFAPSTSGNAGCMCFFCLCL